MSFLAKKIAEWAGHEQGWEELQDKLYGPVLQISLIFPSWKPANRLKTIVIIFLYAATFTFHLILLSVSIFVELKNYNVSILLLHYWLLVFYVICALFIYSWDRRIVAGNHRMLADKMGAHGCDNIYDEDVPKKLEKIMLRETYMLFMMPGMVSVLAAVGLLVPYIKNYNRGELYTENGSSLKLPVPGWYPFPTHEGAVHLVVVIGQLSAAAAIGTAIVGILMTMVRVAQQIRYEYKILGYALETLFSRAEKIHSQQYTAYEVQNKPSNSAFQRCVGLCLRDCVIHHHKLVELVGGFEKVSSWPLGLAYAVGTMVIGISLVNILLLWQAEDYETVIMFGMLSLCEVLNMLTISVIGESITSSSEELRDQLYFTEWHKLNAKNRRLFLNFQVGISEPRILKLGLLAEMRVGTFTSIMNSAYSFFNVMNTTS